MTVCHECVIGFFQSPIKTGIVIISIALSLLFFFLLIIKKDLKLNKKIAYTYSHLFFLIFPFIFYFFFRGCETYFSYCNKLKPILIMIVLTTIFAFIMSLLIAPFLFMRRYLRKSYSSDDRFISNSINKYSEKLNIKKPTIYLFDSGKPIAFSFYSKLKSKIFISIGLLELLKKKEIEAVLLHELVHIKNKSSLFKFSAYFFRFLSPLAMFVSMNKDLNKEERRVNKEVIRMQKKDKYINSAKRKISAFNKSVMIRR